MQRESVLLSCIDQVRYILDTRKSASVRLKNRGNDAMTTEMKGCVRLIALFRICLLQSDRYHICISMVVT